MIITNQCEYNGNKDGKSDEKLNVVIALGRVLMYEGARNGAKKLVN